MTTPYTIIQKKRDGEPLHPDQIGSFITAYVQGDIPDYQMSAFLMAVFFRGMNPDETATLTKCMIASGDQILPSELGSPTADKHSTGGVGDKISIILAPLVAAAGVRVPMMSGRGLGHTGGTLDKLESIQGFNTRLDKQTMIRQIDRIGVAMIGQTDRMVPADKKMYALRDVTATVECIPLIAASIMSKKIASGPQNLVLDVKVGRGAFMKDLQKARELACTMVGIGTAHGRNVQALLTDMHTEPLGRAVGNSLEIIECMDVLRGNGPQDIRTLTLLLAAPMLTMSGTDPDEISATRRLEHLLDTGAAYEKFLQLVEHQGGNPRSLEPPYSLPVSQQKVEIRAETTGYLHGIDPMAIGLTAVALGAGRLRQEDSIDPGVGFVTAVQTGDRIESGQLLTTVYCNRDLSPAQNEQIRRAFEIHDEPVAPPSPLLDRILPRTK